MAEIRQVPRTPLFDHPLRRDPLAWWVAALAVTSFVRVLMSYAFAGVVVAMPLKVAAVDLILGGGATVLVLGIVPAEVRRVWRRRTP